MRDRERKILVVLPTYNERATLPRVIADIHAALPEADILVVDDGSPDGTGPLADTLADTRPWLTVHHRAGKLGLGTAYVHGFRIAIAGGYRFVAEMDSDGSHLARELPTLLAAAEGGAGLAIGTRWIPGGSIENWPWIRRAISRTGTAIARIALRSSLRDLTSGFRVLDTDWLRRLDLGGLDSHGYAFQVETAWQLERLGCPVAEVPIRFVERAGGHSKMSLGIVLEALANVIRWGVELRLGRGGAPAHQGRAPKDPPTQRS
ncbi:polyprenol monophosphomannose synthase [Leucobacter luti]|uniref:polyprenol monophosphomannose synthase n=1 Tax=Leucobacter luti TaxID=340320 RepID=UPI003CFC7927